MTYIIIAACVVLALLLIAESSRGIVFLARVALAGMNWLHDHALTVGAWWWAVWWWLKRRSERGG